MPIKRRSLSLVPIDLVPVSDSQVNLAEFERLNPESEDRTKIYRKIVKHPELCQQLLPFHDIDKAAHFYVRAVTFNELQRVEDLSYSKLAPGEHGDHRLSLKMEIEVLSIALVWARNVFEDGDLWGDPPAGHARPPKGNTIQSLLEQADTETLRSFGRYALDRSSAKFSDKKEDAETKKSDSPTS